MTDLRESVRGVYQQGAFAQQCCFVAFDYNGHPRLKIEVEERDLDDSVMEFMREFLDRKDPITPSLAVSSGQAAS